jgi:hypothetical protein
LISADAREGVHEFLKNTGRTDVKIGSHVPSSEIGRSESYSSLQPVHCPSLELSMTRISNRFSSKSSKELESLFVGKGVFWNFGGRFLFREYHGL